MNNKNVSSATFYVILFVPLFILTQSLLLKGGKQLISLLGGTKAADGDYLTKNGETLAITAIISSLAALILFITTKWASVSGNYLKTCPRAVLIWSALMALGSVLPLQFLAEKINLAMPAGTGEMFESIVKVSWDYVALGIMVPITGEIVFRGAILRVLQDALGERRRWIAIAISALIFGIVHFNLARGLHAFLIGLLLGWLYSETGSILSGLVFHWMNNMVAYLMSNLMPQMNDGKPIDFFHGNDRMMYGGLFFSLCISVPSLLQLIGRISKGNR